MQLSPVCWCSEAQHLDQYRPPATKWPFYFSLRMPDHLVGREHHEGSHLLHWEMLVRQPGNGPCVGNASTALWVNSPLILWFFMGLQPQRRGSCSCHVCVCEIQMAIRALEAIQVIEQQRAASHQSVAACCCTLSTLTSPCFHQLHFLLRMLL